MNDNLPPGAQYDAGAPWNDQNNDFYDKCYTDLEDTIRGQLAHDLTEVLWEVITDRVRDYAAPSHWEDIYDEMKEGLQQELYTELYFELSKLWEK